MYEIRKRVRFHAAHYLEGHPTCGNMHGHTYEVEAVVRGPELNDEGMLVDLGDLGDLMWRVIRRLDHGLLNDTLQQPTAEALAEWIYSHMLILVEGPLGGLGGREGFHLHEVVVWETPTSRASYSRYGRGQDDH